MVTTIKTKVAAGAAIVGLLGAPSAHARMDIELSQGSANAEPYSWYINGMRLSWSHYDGISATGERYVVFFGNAISPQGHCLEIETGPGVTTSNPDTVIWVVDHNMVRWVNDDILGSYQSKARLWIHHSSGTNLPWVIRLQAYSQANNSQDFTFEITRLDQVNESDCTTGSGLAWISINGGSESYTVNIGNAP